VGSEIGNIFPLTVSLRSDVRMNDASWNVSMCVCRCHHFRGGDQRVRMTIGPNSRAALGSGKSCGRERGETGFRQRTTRGRRPQGLRESTPCLHNPPEHPKSRDFRSETLSLAAGNVGGDFEKSYPRFTNLSMGCDGSGKYLRGLCPIGQEKPRETTAFTNWRSFPAA